MNDSIEYAVRRTTDSLYARIEDIADDTIEWTDDPDLATTWPTVGEAVETVAAYGLADDNENENGEWTPTLKPGYETLPLDWQENPEPDAMDREAMRLYPELDD